MAGDYRLDGLAVPAVLEELHELLARVAGEHPDVPTDDLMLLETAVIEIAGNVVEHGRPAGRVPYSFDLDVLPDRLEAVLAHRGERLDDPLGRPMPGDEAVDGRGLPLAELALDRLSYHHEAGDNQWRMTRLRHS